MAIYDYIRNGKLPHWLTIEISIETDEYENTSKYIYIHSLIHLEKRVKLTWSYSTKFTDHEILSDNKLFNYIIEVYNPNIIPFN
jgi:hypothetical protein